jgi:hypothetical protein
MTRLLLGLALGTKMTWLVLFGLLPILFVAFRRLAPRNASRCMMLAQLAGVFAAALVVVNSLYLWQGSFTELQDYNFLSRSLGGPKVVFEQKTDNRFSNSWLGGLPVPLPREYLLGVDRVKLTFERGVPSYFRGEWRHGGWWYYYPYAMAIKIPLGTWALLAIAAAGSVRWRKWKSDEWILAVPMVTIVATVSLQTGFNNHMRYVLPAFPFLFILASKVFSFPSTWLGCICCAALFWSAASSLSVYSSHSGSRWGRPRRSMLNDPGLRYFQEFVPVDRIGYTLLVYHVGHSECNRLRERLLLPALDR